MAREELAGIKGLWRGDKVTFHVVEGEYCADGWDGPAEFTVTVARAQRSNRHGWYITSIESVGPEEQQHFYLDDGWDIRTSDGLRVVA